MLTRQFELRANVDTEERIVSGLAVPFNDAVDVGGYKEMIAPNAVMPRDNIKLFYGHDEPIGKVIDSRDTEAGWSITAKISKTSRGDEVYTLLRDGVLDRFSIGFMPVEQREDKDGTVVRTKIDVREVSIVPIPAYEGAKVEEVRNANEAAQELAPINERMIDVDNVELSEMKETIESLERKVSTLSTIEAAPKVDTRSAGEVIKLIAKNDEAEVRAYTGGTSADAVMQKAWIGDLTRIVNENAPLRNLFSSAALPATGMQVEYAQLKSNTLVVDEIAEGADAQFGKIAKETKYADIKAYGGYTQLTRIEIERSSVEMLNASLQLMAVETGKRLNSLIKADYTALVTAQAANKVDVAVGTEYLAWLEATVDAADKFAANGLGLDALVVGKADFKKLLNLVDVEGRPVFAINGAGNNTIGNLDVTGIGGRLVNVPVVYVPGLTADPAFVNKSAIKMFTSPVVSLQDENIINFSKDFSVYMFAAIADLFPQGIVPVDVVA